MFINALLVIHLTLVVFLHCLYKMSKKITKWLQKVGTPTLPIILLLGLICFYWGREGELHYFGVYKDPQER